jgi:phosphodiesterase/alkaline phosphatase D-like protein
MYFSFRSQMTVAWATECASAAEVQWGPAADSLPANAEANTTSYKFGSYASPYLHSATMTGLKPATAYFYKVGGASSGYSAVFNFTSHPGVGADMPFYFALVGDLGTTSNSKGTLDHILANPAIQAVVEVGDLSYADNTKNCSVWDAYGNLVEPSASHIPWLVLPGNHDRETFVSDQPTFFEYSTRYHMPTVDGTPSLWYR